MSSKNHLISRDILKSGVARDRHIVEMCCLSDHSAGYRFRSVGINQNNSESIHFRTFCSRHDSSMFARIDVPRLKIVDDDFCRLSLIRSMSHEYYKQIRHLYWFDLVERSELYNAASFQRMSATRQKFQYRSHEIRLEIDRLINSEYYFKRRYDYLTINSPPIDAYINATVGLAARPILSGVPVVAHATATNYNAILYAPNMTQSPKITIISGKSNVHGLSYVDMISKISAGGRISWLGNVLVRQIETWGLSTRLFNSLQTKGWDRHLLGAFNFFAPTSRKTSATQFNLFELLIEATEVCDA